MCVDDDHVSQLSVLTLRGYTWLTCLKNAHTLYFAQTNRTHNRSDSVANKSDDGEEEEEV